MLGIKTNVSLRSCRLESHCPAQSQIGLVIPDMIKVSVNKVKKSTVGDLLVSMVPDTRGNTVEVVSQLNSMITMPYANVNSGALKQT